MNWLRKLLTDKPARRDDCRCRNVDPGPVRPQTYDHDQIVAEIDNFVAVLQERYGVTQWVCFWSQQQGDGFNDGYRKKGDEHYLFGLLMRWIERTRQGWRNDANENED